MELVINLDDEIYRHVVSMQFCAPGLRSGKSLLEKILKAIRTGTPLPKGHGDLKDELDLDLSAPSLGTDEYINDLMAKHNIDYANGDDEDKVRAFALDLIDSCMNVIDSTQTIIGADKEE
jgi:hypothetical protein